MSVAGTISSLTLLPPTGSAAVHLDEHQFIRRTCLYVSDALKNPPIQEMTLGLPISGKAGSRCACESYSELKKAWPLLISSPA
jgi:hypothetical protein